jgi:hypothetical protein
MEGGRDQQVLSLSDDRGRDPLKGCTWAHVQGTPVAHQGTPVAHQGCYRTHKRCAGIKAVLR